MVTYFQPDDEAARPRFKKRGFTLVELMAVVAMVAVLAALAIQGVGRYLALAKSSEAKNTVGAIGRAVVAAAQRMMLAGAMPQQKSDNSGQGATVFDGVPGLCSSSLPVPASLQQVKARKYQPKTLSGFDYQTGNETAGWRCLQFQISHPQYYQYRYELNGPPISVQLPNGGSPKGAAGTDNRPWTAWARGDVDGNGVTSWFVLTGISNQGKIVKSTAIEQDPHE
jgi:type IV pilus assembly protein PilA